MTTHQVTHSYFWKAATLGYVLLPPVDCLPSMLMGEFTSLGSVSVTYAPQQDGSRLKIINNRGHRFIKKTGTDLLYTLTSKFIDREPIWPQNHATKKELLKYIHSGVVTKKTHIYTCVWLQNFLNGSRVIPLLADLASSTFYDLSMVFDTRTPEDEYGVIVPFDISGPILINLTMPHTNIVPTLVNYQDTRRMCHLCGRVCDISIPPLHPWVIYGNSISVPLNFKKTHGVAAFNRVEDYTKRKKAMIIRHNAEKAAMARERQHIVDDGFPVSVKNPYDPFMRAKPKISK